MVHNACSRGVGAGALSGLAVDQLDLIADRVDHGQHRLDAGPGRLGQAERRCPLPTGGGQESAAAARPARVREQGMQPLRPAGAVLGERVPRSRAVAELFDLRRRQPRQGKHLFRQQPHQPCRVEAVGLRPALRATQGASLPRVTQANVETAPLKLTSRPAPARCRLERDHPQPRLPAHRPVTENLTTCRQALVHKLSRVWIEHRCLQDPLAYVDRRVHHLRRASFVDTDLTRPRS